MGSPTVQGFWHFQDFWDTFSEFKKILSALRNQKSKQIISNYDNVNKRLKLVY